MKHDIEYVPDLRQKILMMDIPCEDTTFVYRDNKLVLANTTVPAYTFNNHIHGLSYKFVRKG